MIRVRPSEERGYANCGWFESRHTFSFAEYYDARFMGFSDLRVINDDWLVPGGGFATHTHQDMEIVTYVLEGVFEQQDAMKNVSRLHAGAIQVMSSGAGIRHRKHNPSSKEKLNFLQIWITPDMADAAPCFAQKDFSGANGITRMVSPDGAEGSLPIRQNATIYRVALENEVTQFQPEDNRVYYAHVARGTMAVNKTLLGEGDGAFIKREDQLAFQANSSVDALLFELREQASWETLLSILRA